MMSKLPIPDGVLKQHVVILGKTGAGKSSVMRLLVEHVLNHNEATRGPVTPVCILDPKGDHWGLKTSRDGKEPGYAVAIFGGEHADMPLSPRAGVALAETVVNAPFPCIVDLGGWMIGERTRFFIDFASTYFRKARGTRFLFIDEVHNFAPKGKIPDPDTGKMLHWANRLASEGRGKGLVLVTASQRPQKVHNDLLTSMETLIAMRVIHKADRNAYRDWIEGAGDMAIGRAVLDAVADLKRGSAWVWSPEIKFGPKVIDFPMFRTYDSFKPQAPDAKELKGRADVDLEQVKKRFAEYVQEAEANDPRTLRARIAELERQLKAKPGTAPPVSREALQAAEQRGYERGATEAQRAAGKALKSLKGDVHQAIEGAFHGVLALPVDTPVFTPVRTPVSTGVKPSHARAAGNGAGQKMDKAKRKFLTVLAQRQGKRTTRNQVAIFAGYSSTSGHVDNTLGALRSAGYAEGGSEDVRITEAGLAALGDFDQLPTGEELRRYWLEHAGGKAERAMLEVILKAYPETLTRDEVAEAANYNVTSGHVDNTLGRLRSMDLIKGPGSAIRASEDLFT